MGETAPTLTTAIYDSLRQEILGGMMEPGAKLAVDALARRFQAGGSPVREALSRLSSEGLVDRREQRGFSVAGVDLAQCRELVRTRVMLEGIALRESVAHRTDAWEEGVVLAFHRLSRVARSTAADRYVANPEWERLHGAFHEALIANCPSGWLLRFCRELREQADRYRQLAARHAFTRRNERDEHRGIMDAVLEGRTDEAVRLLGEHYSATLAVIEDGGQALFDKSIKMSVRQKSSTIS